MHQTLERPCAAALGDQTNASTGPVQRWRLGLPALYGPGVCLREPEATDAPQLAALLTHGTPWRFTPSAPACGADWTRFVRRLYADRSAGLSICYAVIREQTAEVAGLIMVRRLELGFDIAECHFLFSETSWTSALPARSLGYVLDFVFRDIALHRLEARSSTGCEGDVLQSLGCVAEGHMRQTCPRQGGFADETTWSMLRPDWLSNQLPSPQRGPACSHRGGPAAEAADAGPLGPLPGWSTAVPTLTGSHVTLREIENRDGAAFLQAMDPAEFEMCFEPPPKTIEMLQQYIAWARRQRALGRAVSFSIFAKGRPDPVGLLQLRSRDERFTVAEWGIFLAPASRGTGVYAEVMSLIMPFVFDTLGAHRLESRSSATNAAAIRSLRRLGAVKEALLRQSFRRRGEYVDDELWALMARDWRGRTQTTPRPCPSCRGPASPASSAAD